MFGYHLYAHASVLTIHCKLLLAAIDIIDSFNWKCRLTQADLYNGCIKMVGWLWNYSNLYWGPFFCRSHNTSRKSLQEVVRNGTFVQHFVPFKQTLNTAV